jgi:hypothetical protein
MFGKYLKEVDASAKRLLWAEEQLRLARAAAQEPPKEMLITAAAYLADCATNGRVPTFQDAAQRRYAMPASALGVALRDAIAFGWIGAHPDWRLYWRDSGLSEECPLVALAKMRAKPNLAR